MKKVLILLVGLVAGTASFAHSSTPEIRESDARVVMTTNHKIKLYVQPHQSKGQLAIRDADGKMIYNTTASLQKGWNQQLDFSNLSTGIYHLTLQVGQKTLLKTFVVQANPEASFIVQEF